MKIYLMDYSLNAKLNLYQEMDNPMAEKILIVDDDLDTLKLVGLMLQKSGFQILAASSGASGIDIALAELPDLILLDVMMPGMDGYEVTRRLRANENTQNIPIIMFTAKIQLEDKVAGFEAGVDDYLTKPTHPSELHAHIKALLTRFSKAKVATGTFGKPSEPAAYQVGVISARGGLGVTTIASNLAASLSTKTNSEVILAEFRPGQGTLCYDLGIEKMAGLTDLLNTPVQAITRKLVEDKLIRIPNAFRILAASPQPKDAALQLNTLQFEAILKNMDYMARYVVVDLGCGLTSLNQKLIKTFKEIMVVVEPRENSIQHSVNLIQDISTLGMDFDRVFVVVNNRLRSDTPQLSVSQTQSYFKKPLEMSFSPAPELHYQASRRHFIASIGDLESVTSVQFHSLASKIEARVRNSA